MIRLFRSASPKTQLDTISLVWKARINLPAGVKMETLLAASNSEDPERLSCLLQPVESALADLPELLVSQSDDWVHPHRAACRDVAGQQRDRD